MRSRKSAKTKVDANAVAQALIERAKKDSWVCINEAAEETKIDLETLSKAVEDNGGVLMAFEGRVRVPVTFDPNYELFVGVEQ